MFRAIFGGTVKKIPSEKLPQPSAFVDVTVAGRAMRSVSIERIDQREVVAADVLGRTGEPAVFVYSTPAGKFRFATRITGVRERMTHFEMPDRIEAVAGGSAQKRSSVRMDVLVTGQWRYAPGGKGVGDFQRGSIRDISRGGCALIMDRQCKTAQMLEVRLHLRADAPPLAVLGEVMRCEQIPTSGKFSHGLRFHGITADEDHAILDFINRRLTELRNRGLA